ncbi:hypothetical protein J1605_015145 [Eschrichtius robustus]|uniref:TIR domain-containing protein n=1 Tax=Eschrichtius robustus TaxID=9764 RepID=A0AB34GCY4_ESCRO|nr:hypothetical protein J1605_015145 [Eschrichtius robustus]
MGSSPREEGVALAIPPLRPSEKSHLFVSYSGVDATWTRGLLSPLEADHAGLRVCLHERDFTPGRNALENVADCIQQSRGFVQSRRRSSCASPAAVWRAPALRSAPHALQRGHLLTLDCVNRGNLPSWKVGTFSTLGVPDPLKEVLEDPEVHTHAVGTVSGARSPASCLRYRGCRITLGIVLILLSSASLFLPLLLGLRERHPAQRFLLITANAFFCPVLMVFSVNALCWF